MKQHSTMTFGHGKYSSNMFLPTLSHLQVVLLMIEKCFEIVGVQTQWIVSLREHRKSNSRRHACCVLVQSNDRFILWRIAGHMLWMRGRSAHRAARVCWICEPGGVRCQEAAPAAAAGAVRSLQGPESWWHGARSPRAQPPSADPTRRTACTPDVSPAATLMSK